jgi:hypothetical protein
VGVVQQRLQLAEGSAAYKGEDEHLQSICCNTPTCAVS